MLQAGRLMLTPFEMMFETACVVRAGGADTVRCDMRCTKWSSPELSVSARHSLCTPTAGQAGSVGWQVATGGFDVASSPHAASMAQVAPVAHTTQQVSRFMLPPMLALPA